MQSGEIVTSGRDALRVVALFRKKTPLYRRFRELGILVEETVDTPQCLQMICQDRTDRLWVRRVALLDID